MDHEELDPRQHAVREDLADASLRNCVTAERYADGQNVQVTRTAPLRNAPAPDAMLVSEALAGEMAQVFEVANGWAWIQLHRDNYVGYAPADTLTQSFSFTTHYVTAPKALVFPEPDLKKPPIDALYLGSELCAGEVRGDYVERAEGGFLHVRTVSPLANFADGFVSVAERFAGVPYLWGGKTAAGLDCSGLVQIAMQAAGKNCPRDSDMQMAQVGTSLGRDTTTGLLSRDDLVFWKGHVGIMTDADTLLHANVFHMEVASEPLREAVARIEADGSPVLDIRRQCVETSLIGAISSTG